MSDQFPELNPLCELVADLDREQGAQSIIVIFGSRARGDHDRWSDYDLLVLSEHLTLQDNRLYRATTDLPVDFQVMTQANYRARLDQWLESTQAHSNPAEASIAESKVLVSSLYGKCLLGEAQFKAFQALRDQWIAKKIAPDPNVCGVVHIDDGLTDFQRAIIGALPKGKRKQKSAGVVGQASQNVIAGSSFLYRVLVKMTHSWLNRYPLIAAQGNFGSYSGMPSAAMRYTECGVSNWYRFGRNSFDSVDKELLGELAQEFSKLASSDREVEKELVTSTFKRLIGHSNNYVPSLFPNLLANGAIGIPGVRSSILGFQLERVADALQLVLEKSDSSDDEVLEKLGIPEIPFGGVIENLDEVQTVLKTGVGSVRVSACHQLAPAVTKQGEAICITTLPMRTSVGDLEDALSELHEQDQLPGVKSIREASSLELGFRVELAVTQKADRERLVEEIYKLPQMHCTIDVDNTVRIDNELKRFGQADLVRHEAQQRLNRLGEKAKVIEELNALRAIDTVTSKTTLASRAS